ncbi:MAG: T9SS type A sorting domain-containing protein, partial [Saprospiraceae bacterium]|nr:T9SS type A sorting domain-containing protein [Saprospiraceae bacterium]
NKGTTCSETENFEFSIYPNPTSNELTVSGEYLLNQQVELKVFDTTGREIFFKEVSERIDRYNLDVSNLPTGLYFVVITSGDSIFSEKFVKI